MHRYRYKYPINTRKLVTMTCMRGIKVTWFAKVIIAPFNSVVLWKSIYRATECDLDPS